MGASQLVTCSRERAAKPLGIGVDILVIGYYHAGTDQKLNTQKCHSRGTGIIFFGKFISWYSIIPDPHKMLALSEMSPPRQRVTSSDFWEY